MKAAQRKRSIGQFSDDGIDILSVLIISMFNTWSRNKHNDVTKCKL